MRLSDFKGHIKVHSKIWELPFIVAIKCHSDSHLFKLGASHSVMRQVRVNGFWKERTNVHFEEKLWWIFEAAKPLVCNPDGDINANIELSTILKIIIIISQTLFMSISSLLTPQPDFCLPIFLWYLTPKSTIPYMF